MTTSHVKRSPAPAPGRGLVPAVIVLTALNLFLLARGFGPAASPDASRGADGPPARGGDVCSYLTGKEVFPQCRQCLDAIRSDLEERRLAAVAKAVEGMVRVPAGEYRIGSPDGVGDPDERPARSVLLDAYYIDKYEVTVGRYLEFARATDGNHPEWLKPGGKFNVETGSETHYRKLAAALKDENTPVVGVAWRDAGDYCRWSGKRLPTEAEWEAAARAGSPARHHFGDTALRAADYMWYEDNSGGAPRPVGGRNPNAFGLHDTAGNVWEWVADWYNPGYYAAGPKRNPRGPETGQERVIRGGSWAFDADSCRPGNRASYSKANDDIGFRCAVSERDVTAGAGGGL